jgi:signal recognition particle GTPase
MYSSRSNLLIGFHGCDESVAKELINYPKKVKISEKPFDWLGHGFYIWENNYDRALEWAKDKEKNGRIKKASVVGIVFTLDHCLDLIDSEFIQTLSIYYDLMQKDFLTLGKDLPKNKDVKEDLYKDLLIRELDCAVIEYLHQKIKEEKEKSQTLLKEFDSVRGVFIEGGPVFPGSGIQKKSRIQICIRNMSCIKGFFLPRK